MRGMFRVILFAALVCMMIPAARAADLSGVWKGTFNFNDADVPTTLNLKVSGSDVTGTVEGLPTSPVDIHDGKVAGDLLSFWVNTEYQGESYKLVFRGQIKADPVKGEQIEFAFGTEDGSWGTSLSVKRDAGPAGAPAATPTPAPAAAATPVSLDVTGTWTGDWDMMGTNVTSTIVLKSAGGVVTGTVSGASGAMNEIHDGKIVGDTITFWINSDYQGQTYKLQYKGKVTAGQIGFDFGLADGSWGAAVTVKKS